MIEIHTLLTCLKGTERRGQGGFVGRAALRVFGYVQGMNPRGAKSSLPQNLDLATDMPDKDFNKSQVIYSGWHHSLLVILLASLQPCLQQEQYKHCQDEAGMGQESLTRAEEGVRESSQLH